MIVFLLLTKTRTEPNMPCETLSYRACSCALRAQGECPCGCGTRHADLHTRCPVGPPMQRGDPEPVSVTQYRYTF
jgi:hypothetical protein